MVRGSLLSLTLMGALAAGQKQPSATTVYISEAMSSNKGFYVGESDTPDYIEIHNYGPLWIDMTGFRISDRCEFEGAYVFPDGVNIGPDERAVLLADGSDRQSQGLNYLDFRLSSSGETVCLFAPDGTLLSRMAIPALGPDQAYGLVSGAEPSSGDYQLMERPTPGIPNSGAAAPTPFDVEVVHLGAVPAGQSFSVDLRSTTPVQAVDLTYLVDRGQPNTVSMTAVADGFTAYIPGQNAGSMIQWYFTINDASGRSHRFPSFEMPWDREYYGTFVDDLALSTNLPVVFIDCKDDQAPFTVGKDAEPGCSVMLNGKFYDNVIVRRRGMSSIAWPKPKFKVDAGYQGRLFELDSDSGRKVKEFGMNSEWFEPGENSFMRETIAWKALDEMGVDALDYYQTQVRFNGAYFGKFSLGEDWDTKTLQEAGYDLLGPLMKSMSGDSSNLRWDIDPWTSKYFYRPITLDTDDAFIELGALATGLAGGTCGSRSAYVFDNLNLPKVINYMSAMTLMLNQDRCTKNFYVYKDPSTEQWSMLPWDVEAALATDRGLGGKPAPDYCILDCEQWNSPLFCDKNHPQDLLVTTPWGLITTDVNPDRAVRRSVRQAAQYPGMSPGTPPNGAAAIGLDLDDLSAILSGWDADQRNLPIAPGVEGTYNHLIDAVLSIPTTRAMAMRRLRTLMDEFLAPDGSGRLAELVTEEYELIRDEAARDNAVWGASGSAERGYQQLLYEQLPIRASQLYGTYSSEGSIPLIPESQPSDIQLEIVGIDQDAGVVQLVNPHDIAVDISGRKLMGTDGAIFKFDPGTVVPANMNLHVASDPQTLRAGLAAGRGGCSGEFILGGGFGRDELNDVAFV